MSINWKGFAIDLGSEMNWKWIFGSFQIFYIWIYIGGIELQLNWCLIIFLVR